MMGECVPTIHTFNTAYVIFVCLYLVTSMPAIYLNKWEDITNNINILNKRVISFYLSSLIMAYPILVYQLCTMIQIIPYEYMYIMMFIIITFHPIIYCILLKKISIIINRTTNTVVPVITQPTYIPPSTNSTTHIEENPVIIPTTINNLINTAEIPANIENLCIICVEQKRNIVFEPCHHLCYCEQCSIIETTCPCCRITITNKIKIFIP